MLMPRLLAAVLLTASHATLAQQLAQPPVDAGTQIQQIPPAPLPPRPAPAIPTLAPPGTVADAAPAGPTTRVTSLTLTGQTLFAEAALIAASGFVPNRDLDLGQLRALAARIAAFYNERGYFLAQAYLPAQDIDDGGVTIAVVEGRYGKIELRNASRLSDRVAHGILSGLNRGDIAATAPLERRLLLLSDVPGIVVKSTLSPGAAPGTSDLRVDIENGDALSGSVEADNGGNRYTGAYRFGGTVYAHNPTGNGDQISLRGLVSTSGLSYGRAAYQAPVGKATLGVAYSHIDYDLGREFKSLDADGAADIVSLFGSYPLVRSRDANLYALIGADAKWFEDSFGAAGLVSRRRARVLTFGLAGDARDAIGGGGWNAYSIGASVGDLDLRTPADFALDQLTARSDGRFGKLQASVARVQTISGPLSLYGAVRGQLASKNLDSSEKMELGGAYAVRAYPEGEAYGDEGYLATLEARYLFPAATPLPGQLQAIAFVDAGAVRYAKNPWFTGSNSAHRSGYGAGLIWSAPNDFIAKATYARKLGSQDATSAPDRDGRFWFQVAKLF
jgi:hemolysin activation/secretion protein